MNSTAVGGAAAIPLGYDSFPLDEEHSCNPQSSSSLFLYPADLIDAMTADTPTSAMEPSMRDLEGASLGPSYLRQHSGFSSYPPMPSADAAGGAAQIALEVDFPPGLVAETLHSPSQEGGNFHCTESTSPGTASTPFVLTPTSTVLEDAGSGSEAADIGPDRSESWSPTSAHQDRLGGAFADQSVYGYSPGAGPSVRSSALMSNPASRPPRTDSSASDLSRHLSPGSPIAQPSVATSSFMGAHFNNFDGTDILLMAQPTSTQASSTLPGSYTYAPDDPGAYSNDMFNPFVASYPPPDGPFVGNPMFQSVSMHQTYSHPVSPLDEFDTPMPTAPGPSSLAVSSDLSHQSLPGLSPGERVLRERMYEPDWQTSTIPEPPPNALGVAEPSQQGSALPQFNELSSSRPKSPQRSSSHGSPAIASSSRTVPRTDHSDVRPRPRGGREKGARLPPEVRNKALLLRKSAACWRCALRRDACDLGDPCSRCLGRPQKGHAIHLDCDRRKLPDFNYDFLPPSMTGIHQKQAIEDTVRSEIITWDFDRPIDVFLTSGYGHPLRWTLYEFTPRSIHYLYQLQFKQDAVTGLSRETRKYSPPLALRRLDASDDQHFNNYIDELLERECLWEFGWTFYEEESQVDNKSFAARMLQLMCDLYMDTPDDKLRHVLKDILRMMIITYIMGHTLTIEETTLPSVLASLQSPQPGQIFTQTSPRLANRQLKFFFSILRHSIYDRMLKWLQQTLRSGRVKDDTWLPAFCATLGFAMILEEIQRTLMVQADAKVSIGEETYERAAFEARNACERIDSCFRLLIAIFQFKYRDKTWTATGSFGPGTPLLRDPTNHRFLTELYQLVTDRADHLERRRDIEFGPTTQCKYTSRLVARFLLPFLPPTSSPS